MLEIIYLCSRCGRESSPENQRMTCEHCGGYLRGESAGITGTRDNFGINKAFISPEGKKIDNWKSWERAGYRNPLETVKDSNVRSGIKRKIDKIKHDKNKGV